MRITVTGRRAFLLLLAGLVDGADCTAATLDSRRLTVETLNKSIVERLRRLVDLNLRLVDVYSEA